MIPARANRFQLAVVFLLLVVLHFYVRPRLWGPRSSPDFMFVALMLFAMRSSPGAAALAGFAVGLVADSLTPARFGAAALAHTMVGYVGSWARAVFFADNLLVLTVSGGGSGSVLTELTVYSPLQAISSALFALIVLVAFREWFSIRLDA
jgi:rod shape-determining protein MreD